MPLRISAARNERGVALPLALLTLVMLSGLLLAFLAMSVHEPQIAQNHGSASRAFHIADAGIEHAWAVLPSTDLTTLPLTRFSNEVFGGGSYTVIITKPGADYILTSTGTFKDSTQTVVMVFSVTPGGSGPGLPTLPAAITSVSNGSDEVDLEGSGGDGLTLRPDASFVTGNDESADPTCAANKAGWVHRNATPGEGPGPSFQFDYQGGTLQGVGSTVGAGAHRAFNAATDDPRFNDPVALRAWVNNLASQPGVENVNGMTGHPTTMGTAASPKITVWNLDDTGEHSTNAPITGHGILILKGPSVSAGQYHWFSVKKAFQFSGLIIVDSPGEVSFDHYKSPPDVVMHGAIIAVSEKTGGEATKVDFEKNSRLFYNCAAIRDYALPLAGSGGGGTSSFTQLSWRQQ